MRIARRRRKCSGLEVNELLEARGSGYLGERVLVQRIEEGGVGVVERSFEEAGSGERAGAFNANVAR